MSGQGDRETGRQGDKETGCFPSRVVLIGPRGSGKTTVARLLAAAMGWGWIDADAELARRAGVSVRDIFAAEGEAGFRRREADLLRELLTLDRHVLATGGGVVVRPENRALLREAGIVVWLTADVDTLWSRIAGDEGRPALLGGGREEVEQIVAMREPLYRECAHHIIETGSRPPTAVVADVLDRLRSGA